MVSISGRLPDICECKTPSIRPFSLAPEPICLPRTKQHKKKRTNTFPTLIKNVSRGLWVTDWECAASPDILGTETGAVCPGASESQGAVKKRSSVACGSLSRSSPLRSALLRLASSDARPALIRGRERGSDLYHVFVKDPPSEAHADEATALKLSRCPVRSEGWHGLLISHCASVGRAHEWAALALPNFPPGRRGSGLTHTRAPQRPQDPGHLFPPAT